jgi:hypothetical protein
MPGAVRRFTRILWPGMAWEKTPRGVSPPVCVKYRRTPKEKRKKNIKINSFSFQDSNNERNRPGSASHLKRISPTNTLSKSSLVAGRQQQQQQHNRAAQNQISEHNQGIQQQATTSNSPSSSPHNTIDRNTRNVAAIRQIDFDFCYLYLHRRRLAHLRREAWCKIGCKNIAFLMGFHMIQKFGGAL